MKAWRFYGFGDLRLDDVPEPECAAQGHVLVAPLCVQPSVTEANWRWHPDLGLRARQATTGNGCADPTVRP